MTRQRVRHPAYFPSIVLGVTFILFFIFVEFMLTQRFIQTQYFDIAELFFLSGLAILPIVICIVPLALLQYRKSAITLAAIPMMTFGVVLLTLDVLFHEQLVLITFHVFIWGCLWSILLLVGVTQKRLSRK